MGAPSPVEGAGDGVAYQITLGGRPMDPAVQLVSIEVRRRRGRPPVARLTFLDGDPETGDFPLSAQGGFAPGVAITVALGYGETVTEVFSGLVGGQGLRIPDDGPSRLVVEASDRRTGVAVDGGPAVAAEPVLTLTWGESILDLDLEMDPAPPHVSRGRVRFQGSALPTPGGAVTLAGLGTRFNGRAEVAGVRHRLGDGGWTTELEIEVSPVGARPHHVGRLSVEATMADGGQAQAIGERLQRLADGALAAVLERVFDGLELGDRLVRLDRLDLELGTVRPDRLEEDVMAALGRTLPGALKQALAARQAP